jgi:hypothetical protein
MIPKEKAQELYDSYFHIVADTPDPEWRSKQAALIAVDQILEHCYQVMKPFWQEVKQEIENL